MQAMITCESIEIIYCTFLRLAYNWGCPFRFCLFLDSGTLKVESEIDDSLHLLLGDNEMTKNATVALYAAQNVHVWGRDAAVRYVLNRGCPLYLFRLARQLQAGEKA